MMTAALKERLQRVLGRPTRAVEPSTVLKLAVLGGVLLVIGLLVVFADHAPNLSHLRVGACRRARGATTMRSSAPSPAGPHATCTSPWCRMV
jgi:hypothetical protein